MFKKQTNQPLIRTCHCNCSATTPCLCISHKGVCRSLSWQHQSLPALRLQQTQPEHVFPAGEPLWLRGVTHSPPQRRSSPGLQPPWPQPRVLPPLSPFLAVSPAGCPPPPGPSRAVALAQSFGSSHPAIPLISKAKTSGKESRKWQASEQPT